MKAHEITAQVTPQGEVSLPEHVRQELPAEGIVRLIVLIDEESGNLTGDRSWNRLTVEQFLSGYDDIDSIYDSV